MSVIKTPHEIAKLRECADLVARTLAEVAKHIAPGVRTSVLDRVAEAFIYSHGAVPAFKGYRMASLPPFPSSLCISINDAVVHGIPDDYMLREGDLVSVDCGVEMNGYFGDSAYTFGVGDLSPEDIQLCTVTFEAMERGIASATPHGTIGDIGAAIYRHCNNHGMGVVRELVGHGIGRKLHEPPHVPNIGSPRRGRRLRTGMVLCIEPMINLGTSEVLTASDGWTICSADGSSSAHYEHMVCVTPSGPDVLTTFEYIEEITTPPYRMKALSYG